MSLLRLGKLLMERRGTTGIREFARELGISPATLSRVERGKLPDIETFSKICKKLNIDPSDLLQLPKNTETKIDESFPSVAVHFKADSTLTQAAATDLAQLILAAQREMKRLRS